MGGFNTNTGTGDLTIAVASSPDFCVDAIPINEVVDYPYSTACATDSGTTPSCGSGIMNDIWFAYTATETCDMLFDLLGIANYDTRMALYDDCPGGGGTELICNDDYVGLLSGFIFSVTQGVTYYVQVGGYSGATGIGDLSIQPYTLTWTGNTSTDWNNTGNWTPATVPSSSVSALIPTTPAGGNFPETNTSGNAIAYNLTIEPGAHVYVPPTATLTLVGSLSNQGGG